MIADIGTRPPRNASNRAMLGTAFGSAKELLRRCWQTEQCAGSWIGVFPAASGLPEKAWSVAWNVPSDFGENRSLPCSSRCSAPAVSWKTKRNRRNQPPLRPPGAIFITGKALRLRIVFMARPRERRRRSRRSFFQRGAEPIRSRNEYERFFRCAPFS